MEFSSSSCKVAIANEADAAEVPLFPGLEAMMEPLSGGLLAPLDDLKSRSGQPVWRHDNRLEIRVLSLRALAIWADEEVRDHRRGIVPDEFGPKPFHCYTAIWTARIADVPQGMP
ncbi:hypothetical protein ACVIW2_005951 [Bradyrhizobium huanghuaihaiense]|uniref:hypothetical protein n=1 Tax=unclassified Bradyrhizobium TaxID=2631580 RepID=UPI0013043233|nr:MULTISPECIES: hypothetical protein [unclassified Bradyrhizobium]